MIGGVAIPILKLRGERQGQWSGWLPPMWFVFRTEKTKPFWVASCEPTFLLSTCLAKPLNYSIYYYSSFHFLYVLHIYKYNGPNISVICLVDALIFVFTIIFHTKHAPFISLSFHLTHMHLRSLQAPSLTFHKYNFILTLGLAIWIWHL